MAIRRAGGGASYVPFAPVIAPWHSAMAATYAHATAPLRRLADRYVVMAALAVANGQPVPDPVQAAFPRLPRCHATRRRHGRPDRTSGHRPRRGRVCSAAQTQERSVPS